MLGVDRLIEEGSTKESLSNTPDTAENLAKVGVLSIATVSEEKDGASISCTIDNGRGTIVEMAVGAIDFPHIICIICLAGSGSFSSKSEVE